MTMIPVLEILFAFILSFLPEGTNKFTVTSGANDKTLICELQEDGTWNAETKKGKSIFKGWKKTGMKLVKTTNEAEPQRDIDLSDYISRKGKNLLIEGKSVKIEKTTQGVYFVTTSIPYMRMFRVEIEKSKEKLNK